MSDEPTKYVLNPKVKISEYKVIGGERLSTPSIKLELDGEIGFAPKSMFVSNLSREKDPLVALMDASSALPPEPTDMLTRDFVEADLTSYSGKAHLLKNLMSDSVASENLPRFTGEGTLLEGEVSDSIAWEIIYKNNDPYILKDGRSGSGMQDDLRDKHFAWDEQHGCWMEQSDLKQQICELIARRQGSTYQTEVLEEVADEILELIQPRGGD